MMLDCKPALLVVFIGLLSVTAGCQPAEIDNEGILPTEGSKTLTLYLTDENRFIAGIEPYEVPVVRQVSISEPEAEALLRLLFEGPTDEEYNQGLRFISSGCTGFSSVEVDGGVARVQLTGDCASGGATYTIANLIFVNLNQLAQVEFVKIYDQAGETEQPDGKGNSIPFSLEP